MNKQVLRILEMSYAHIFYYFFAKIINDWLKSSNLDDLSFLYRQQTEKDEC